MSKSWSKEDKFHYEKSEVFQELEKSIVDNLKRLDILQDKMAAAAESPPPVPQATIKSWDDFGDAVEEASSKLAADDNEVGNSPDDEADDEATKMAIIGDLRDLIKSEVKSSDFFALDIKTS